jgi:hypothetical protein
MKEPTIIKISEAIKQMRELTSSGVPFSFGFITCNSKQSSSNGYRVVSKAILRSGLRNNQSDKGDVLIGYIDHDDSADDKNRFFNYPLLMMFNGHKVQP